jgi:hypothetical protein
MSLDPDLETELLQVIRRHPLPLYSIGGTALGKNSFLEAKYQDSSQGTYVVKCPGCGIDNDMGEVEHCLRMVRPQGLCCRKCDHSLRGVVGLFVHRKPAELEIQNIGLRVPQIAIPDIADDIKEYNDIYDSLHGNNVNKAVQEILGIPVDEADRELTLEEVKAICVLGPKRQPVGFYRYVISGCDWGGSDYSAAQKTKKSNTAHVVIGIRHTGEYDIIHMAIHAGKDYFRVISDILTKHLELGGTHIGSDHGVGMFYNTMIRTSGKVSPLNHYIIQYGGSPRSIVAPMSTANQLGNAYVAHKTESLSALFSKLKKGRIRCFDWAAAEPFLMEFMNMHRVMQETSSGLNRFTYHKNGQKTDDVVQALNFAQIAASIVTGEELITTDGLLESVVRETEMQDLVRREMDAAAAMHTAQQEWSPTSGYETGD